MKLSLRSLVGVGFVGASAVNYFLLVKINGQNLPTTHFSIELIGCNFTESL